MKNLTTTIIKKEFARFFGDRALFFTTVLMPGLLIYMIYSLMGTGISNMTKSSSEPTTVYVENPSEVLLSRMQSSSVQFIVSDFCADSVLVLMKDKEVNCILVSFPINLDDNLQTKDSSVCAPNICIYHNSLNPTASKNYKEIVATLDSYESRISNVYDINRADSAEQSFDMATEGDELGELMKSLFPMLLLMLIFSGCMAVAPNAIAGEKERGTIAILLVTPMKRSQLALGKIISLSCIVLLSGLSSFLGVILSLPKLFAADGVSLSITDIYSPIDYLLLLCLILSTTLVMVSVVSLFSAWAKDVKTAGTMTTPFMLIVMLCGLLPMLQGNVEVSLPFYFIPFYNTVQCMSHIFTFDMHILPMLTTIGMNLVYTGLAVFVLTKMFGSEKVMFGK